MLPLPILMTSLSPTMGSLAARTGPRIPLTAGPLVVAAGMCLAVLARADSGYWTGIFPMILVMAAGMTIAVAPLTSSVLGSVEEQHVAMASGFNSAVARTGGLIATALLGVGTGQQGRRAVRGVPLGDVRFRGGRGAQRLVALTMLGGVRMKAPVIPGLIRDPLTWHVREKSAQGRGDVRRSPR